MKESTRINKMYWHTSDGTDPQRKVILFFKVDSTTIGMPWNVWTQSACYIPGFWIQHFITKSWVEYMEECIQTLYMEIYNNAQGYRWELYMDAARPKKKNIPKQ